LCTGSPSYASNPYQASITAAFTDGAHGLGGEFGAGGEALFVTGGVSFVNYRDLEETSTHASLGVGAELGVSENRNVFVCPLARMEFGSGPDIGTADISSFVLIGGGSVGVVASQSSTLMVVPTFGLAANYSRFNVEFGGRETTETDTSGRAVVGVGFIFDNNVGITPALVIPFSAGDTDPIFAIKLSFGFGG
jgi:hypothetical protein